MFIKTSWSHMFRLTSRKKFCKRVFVGVVIMSMIISTTYLKMLTPEFNHYDQLRVYDSKQTNNSPKRILLATDFFNLPNWFLGADTRYQDFFEEWQCLHTNCIITRNRNHLPSINLFDAVVFNMGTIFPKDTVPSTRSSEQLYVYANNEAPFRTIQQIDSDNEFYNITMTHRLDSDIVWPYGLIRDIETKVIVAPAFKPHWKSAPDNFTPDETLLKRINGKTKKAAWFVSDCITSSQRKYLGLGIQNKFGLDIYGKCGNLSCERTTMREEKCYAMLDNDYKFYLAFENTLCEDYVSEKLYYSLERDIIPIVYGGADYNRFAPPHSYINAEDFPTTSALVKYLEYLDSNPTEYNKYFWWKKHYEVSYETPFCQLCAILNNPASTEKTQIYKNIRKWWFENTICRTHPNMVFD